MVTACIYCGGPLIPVLGRAHWRRCKDECKGSSTFEGSLLPPEYMVIRRPKIEERGKPNVRPYV